MVRAYEIAANRCPYLNPRKLRAVRICVDASNINITRFCWPLHVSGEDFEGTAGSKGG